MFERIVVAVDGSDHAVKAAGVAGDLAEKYGSEVILLHVIDRSHLSEAEEHMAEVEHVAQRGRGDPPWVANVPAELAAMLQPRETTNQRDRMLGYLADKVVKAATEQLEAHGVAEGRIRILFKNGHPVKRTLETVEQEKADLLVTGSRGVSDVAGTFAGSVSHRVMHLAPCSVITVK